MVFLNVTKYSDPEELDWWELNPQTKYYNPFSKLYKRDKSSSKDMWFIFFMCEPDERINTFYSMEFEARLKMLLETFHPDFNIEDPLIQECVKAYPEACLTAVGRAYKMEKDSMMNRGVVLATTPYTMDSIATDAKGATIYVAGKPLTIKGTAKDLDSMRANTARILNQYIALDKIFIEEKKALRLYGGRQETLLEKGNVLKEIDRDKLILGE
jgi:hypothetical protein